MCVCVKIRAEEEWRTQARWGGGVGGGWLVTAVDDRDSNGCESAGSQKARERFLDWL